MIQDGIYSPTLGTKPPGRIHGKQLPRLRDNDSMELLVSAMAKKGLRCRSVATGETQRC